MTYQTVIIVGNLGRDPEMRYTPSGQAVTNLSVAVSESYTNNQGEKVERTLWFRVATWGKQAEVCNQYLKKGSKVLVEGRLVGDDKGNPRTYQRQDGSTGASFEISAQNVRFLSSRAETESAAHSSGAEMDQDEIPF
jgi:single-strand DNA-binding protein